MTKKEEQNKPQIVLSHMMLNSFVEVTIPPGTTSLTMNENYITDFVGLNSLKRLENLCMDKNPIISFRGFPKLKNLTNLSLIDTPISKLSNFRALAINVAGQQLKTLNGIEVSSHDRSAALAYGPPETTCQLIVRGWLPRKPVSLPARKSRQNTDNNNSEQKNLECRILKIVDEQENDPISVRITRILRAQGYGISQIREFLHDFFSPHSPKKKESKRLKEDSSVETQIKKQQQIIDVLAAQLQALRSGNRTFNDYDEMIRTSGRNLLKNAEILKKSETEQNDNQSSIKSQELATETKPKKKNKPEYELLRSAIVDFLQVPDETDDKELIRLLDSIRFQNAHEEEEEEYLYLGDQQKYQQQQQLEQQNQTNNDLTEEEILPSDDDIIPRLDNRNIIADMSENQLNSQNQQELEEEEEIIFNEEEEEKIDNIQRDADIENDFNIEEEDDDDDDLDLNKTADKGINVPDYKRIITHGESDDEVKKMLEKMDQFLDEDTESNQNMIESQTENDSNELDDNHLSS